MKFSSIDDDHEGDWQTHEISKLNKLVTDLMHENTDLRSKLDQKLYSQTYKDNQRLELELKSMYILQEQN